MPFSGLAVFEFHPFRNISWYSFVKIVVFHNLRGQDKITEVLKETTCRIYTKDSPIDDAGTMITDICAAGLKKNINIWFAYSYR